MESGSCGGQRRSRGAVAIAAVCCCSVLPVLLVIRDGVSSTASSSRLTFFGWRLQLRPALLESRGASPAGVALQARGTEADPEIVIKQKESDSKTKKGFFQTRDEEVCVVSFKDGEVIEECRDISIANSPTKKEGVTSLSQNDDEIDPYKVLGVTFTAKQEQIKAAYMAICKKQHPDLNGGYESLEFQQASRAYRILSKERTKYNLTSGTQKVASVAGGIFDLAFAVAAAGVTAVTAAASKPNKSDSTDGSRA